MNAAIIGMGPHGKRVAKVLSEFPGVALDAVVDMRPEALDDGDISASTARMAGADELWKAPCPELVCITTNGPSHAELAVSAMRAGAKYVLVEKPMATSLEECDLMVRTAEECGVRLAVDHLRRKAPVNIWVRETVASGRWGALRSISIQRPGIGLGCLGTHSFDMILDMSGQSARRVTAWVDEPVGRNPRGEQFVDPGGLVVLEMESGCRGIVSQIEDGAGPASIEIDLTAARIRMDEKIGTVELVERDLSVKPGPGRPPKYTVVEPPDGITAKTDLFQMLHGVIDELIGDGPMECSADRGVETIEMLVGAYLSHRRGNIPIELPITSQEDRAVWLPVT